MFGLQDYYYLMQHSMLIAQVYCQQLECLNQALKKKKTHTARITSKKNRRAWLEENFSFTLFS